MKKLIGSVSLFAALIFMMVTAVITASITSARTAAAKVMVATSLSMALDSLFSMYNSELFSEFGVLLYDMSQNSEDVNRENISGIISDYMSYTLDPNKGLLIGRGKDLYGINQEGVAINEIIRATDSAGLIWENMVVDYEKYAKIITLVAEYLEIGNETEAAKNVSKLNTEIIYSAEKASEISKETKNLVALIDGINCPSDGINFNKLEIKENFIKKFCPFNCTSDNLRITNKNVYDKVAGNIKRPDEQIEEGQYKLVMEELEKNIAITNEALAILLNIDITTNMYNESMDRIDGLIEENKEILGDTLVEEFSGKKEIKINQIIDTTAATNTLNNNIAVLYELKKLLSENKDTEEQNNKMLEELKSYTFKGLEIDYSTLEKKESKEISLAKISESWQSGILSLVVPEGKTISDRSFDINDLAHNSCDISNTKELQKNINEITKQTKRIIYIEYVMDKFISFMDDKQGAALNYEVEYILYGNKSDKKNLFSTVSSIAGIRSASNFIYLWTDEEKREQAYDLATALVSFTGMEALVRLTQVSIMYMWSYAEAVSDVKILLAGNKVKLIKTEEDWKLTLDNMLSCCIPSSEGSDSGLDYNDYLKFLLYIENDGKRSAYTMDLVELWMIASGHEKFRLKNYIFGIDVETIYTLSGLDLEFTEHAVYTY